MVMSDGGFIFRQGTTRLWLLEGPEGRSGERRTPEATLTADFVTPLPLPRA